ncbi:uncharacterized protein [Palaemon carinicauda]|uniref:uncharacterized protein n=1 Tax=Palaemon carinicauda TaxID=392227 RepID=UPI0035B67A56
MQNIYYMVDWRCGSVYVQSPSLSVEMWLPCRCTRKENLLCKLLPKAWGTLEAEDPSPCQTTCISFAQIRFNQHRYQLRCGYHVAVQERKTCSANFYQRLKGTLEAEDPSPCQTTCISFAQIRLGCVHQRVKLNKFWSSD